MWDFSIARSFGVMMRSAGAMGLRLLVFAGIALAIAIATLAGGWAGHLIGMIGSEAFQISTGFWGGLLAFLASLAAVFFLRDQLLFHLTVPHALSLSRLVGGGEKLSLAAARQLVADRIGQPAALMVLDRLLQKAIREITALVGTETIRLPVAGMEDSERATRFWLRRAEAQADMLVLGQVMEPGPDDPFTAAQRGLVLEASIAPSVLSNGAWLAVFRWAFYVIAFLILIGPGAMVANLLPVGGIRPALAFAALFTWAAKSALVDPFVQASLLQLLPDTAESDPGADPEIRATLDEGSPAFHALTTRAQAWEPV